MPQPEVLLWKGDNPDVIVAGNPPKGVAPFSSQRMTTLSTVICARKYLRKHLSPSIDKFKTSPEETLFWSHRVLAHHSKIVPYFLDDEEILFVKKKENLPQIQPIELFGTALKKEVHANKWTR